MTTTVPPMLADFLHLVSLAETPRQIDAAIRSLPLDLDKIHGPDADQIARQSIADNLGDGLILAMADAVRRFDRAALPRTEDTQNITLDELAAAASGGAEELTAALSRAPVNWDDYTEAAYDMDDTELAYAGGLAVVVASHSLPGHFIGAALAEAIIKAVDRLATLKIRGRAGLGDAKKYVTAAVDMAVSRGLAPGYVLPRDRAELLADFAAAISASNAAELGDIIAQVPYDPGEYTVRYEAVADAPRPGKVRADLIEALQASALPGAVIDDEVAGAFLDALVAWDGLLHPAAVQ